MAKGESIRYGAIGSTIDHMGSSYEVTFDMDGQNTSTVILRTVITPAGNMCIEGNLFDRIEQILKDTLKIETLPRPATIEPTPIRCETCIFSKRIHRVSYVRCMRYPPQIDPEVNGWTRPDMAKNDWCGEWKSERGDTIGDSNNG